MLNSLIQYSDVVHSPELALHLAVRWNAHHMQLKLDMPVPTKATAEAEQDEQAYGVIVQHNPLEVYILSGSHAGYVIGMSHEVTFNKLLWKFKDISKKDLVGFLCHGTVVCTKYPYRFKGLRFTDKDLAYNRKILRYRQRIKLTTADKCPEWVKGKNCYTCARGQLPLDSYSTHRTTCEYATNKVYKELDHGPEDTPSPSGIS